MRLSISGAVFGLGAIALLGMSSVQAQTPVKGGILTFSSFGNPNTLDCHAYASGAIFFDIAPGYSTLLRYDPDAYPNIIGDLVDNWTVSPDKLSYTFRLKSNVKFHDGTALTSEDVKASYDRMRNPPQGVTSLRAGLYAGISAIETPDPLTVVFKFSKLNPMAMLSFANPFGCIYSAKKLAENPKFPETNIMGTGPFKLTEYVPGATLSYVRNENYFMPGLPYLDGLKVVLLQAAAMSTALSGGQVDLAPNQLTPAGRDQIAAVRGSKTIFLEGPYNVTNLVDINNTKAPLNDVRVRRALNLALDRRAGDQIMRKAFSAKGYGALLPEGVIYDMSPQEMDALPGFGANVAANREQAKKLLAEAGVKDLKLTLLNRAVGEPYTSLGVYVIDQLRQIGVSVEQRNSETAVYFSSLSGGNFDIAIDANSFVSSDPSEILLKYVPGGNQNWTGAKDPLLTELYEKQAIEEDTVKRRTLVTQFQKRVVDQAYVIPMFRSISIGAMADYVHGYKILPHPTMAADFRATWMDKR